MKPYYQDEQCTIYHGDCREVLPTLAAGSVDVVLTDPQYFLPPPGHNAKGDQEWVGSLGDLAMFEAAYAEVFKGLKRLTHDTGQLYLCCHDRSYPAFYRLAYCLWPKVSLIVWYKPTGRVGNGWRRSHELILHAAGKRATYSDGFRLDVVGIMPVRTMKRSHPAEKPGELGDFLLEAVPSGVCLDPFMGSGTFLVAAKSRGMKAIGIEIEERYCEIAVKRLAQGVLL